LFHGLRQYHTPLLKHTKQCCPYLFNIFSFKCNKDLYMLGLFSLVIIVILCCCSPLVNVVLLSVLLPCLPRKTMQGLCHFVALINNVFEYLALNL
jgi:hypothetical protein